MRLRKSLCCFGPALELKLEVYRMHRDMTLRVIEQGLGDQGHLRAVDSTHLAALAL